MTHGIAPNKLIALCTFLFPCPTRTGTTSCRSRLVPILLVLNVTVLTCPSPSQALEKYGRPLPAIGDVGEEGVARSKEELGEPGAQEWLRGYLLTAAFVDNPTFAARPNNTGLVGLRHMVHLETDLYKDYLQFYTDQNFFSDRTKGWITLTEWDQTYAFTGSLGNFGWRIQYEQDAPLDQSGLKQTYADTVITYAIDPLATSSWWRRYFPYQNLTAYAGAGWLFYNDTYLARPDNTGRALYRYVATPTWTSTRTASSSLPIPISSPTGHPVMPSCRRSWIGWQALPFGGAMRSSACTTKKICLWIAAA